MLNKPPVPIGLLSEILRKEMDENKNMTREQLFGLFLQELIVIRKKNRKQLAYECFLLDAQLDDLLIGNTPVALIDDDIIYDLARNLNFPVSGFRIILRQQVEENHQYLEKQIVAILNRLDGNEHIVEEIEETNYLNQKNLDDGMSEPTRAFSLPNLKEFIMGRLSKRSGIRNRETQSKGKLIV